MKMRNLFTLVLLLVNVTITNAQTGIVLKKELQTNTWVPTVFLKVLESGDRNMVLKINPDIEKNKSYDPAFDKLFVWYDYGFFDIMDMRYGIDEITGNEYLYFGDDRYFNIVSIIPKRSTLYEIKVTEDPSSFELSKENTYNSIIDVSQLDDEKNYILTFTFDGDYLKVSSREKKVELQYFKCNEKTLEVLKNIIFYDKYNKSKIIWPHHADGTCDYDGSAKSASSKPAPSAILVSGTTKRVNTNLRLRSTEDTSSTVITTMQAGTSVRILKTGSSDTIEGITSNWVQVEVLPGGKDKNGKLLPEGTKGWCFGGYLE